MQLNYSYFKLGLNVADLNILFANLGFLAAFCVH